MADVKTPKGTRDYGALEMALRESVIAKITSVFKKHGATTIDTPVFELKEILTNKYGEDSKLIYDLKDQGGELCALRYDLTVPFARYLAMNKQISNMKRYHIAKVYRRDQPALTKGRYREFYQCDFDIAGAGLLPLLPDAEVLKVLVEIITSLDLGNFVIKCNNRKILDGIFAFCAVDEAKFRTICSSVDKLDKMSWQDVRSEMVNEKGLAPEIADRIGAFVNKQGRLELVEELLASDLSGNDLARQGLEEIRVLFSFLEAFKITKNVIFDTSLARGLDYYTGVIFEAVLLPDAAREASIAGAVEKDAPALDVGSIAGGGRYDNLVGMFSNVNVPCVGASFGIERVFALMMARARDTIAASPVQVFVAAAGGDLVSERLGLLNTLWEASINAEMSQKAKIRTMDQFTYCEKNGIPWAVVIGPEEVAAGRVKIRNVKTREEQSIFLDQLIPALKANLQSA